MSDLHFGTLLYLHLDKKVDTVVSWPLGGILDLKDYLSDFFLNTITKFYFTLLG